MKKSKIYILSLSFILSSGLITFLFAKWQSIPLLALEEEMEAVEEKQKGAHVFGLIDSTNSQGLINNNIEWVTLVSWANQKDYNDMKVAHHNGDSLELQKTNSRWVERIQFARNCGFKVFFKPHIWINTPTDGKWRNDIFPKNETDWNIWKQSYRDYIIRFARIAEEANAEMFCVGTELSRLSVEKPEYWVKLIQEVRSIYSGQITYAANWYNEYEKITFWEDLDYIGIQAYFPLAEINYPTTEELSMGWNKYLNDIKSVYKKYKRKVLFTEMGYRSTADSAIKPWEWAEDPSNKHDLFSAETQANCYQVFFDLVWDKSWFAGVHFWQLRSDFSKEKRPYTLDFTPQGKLAEEILVNGFE